MFTLVMPIIVFSREHGWIAGRFHTKECLFGCSRGVGDSFGLSGGMGPPQMLILGVYSFLLRFLAILSPHFRRFRCSGNLRGRDNVVNGQTPLCCTTRLSDTKRKTFTFATKGVNTMIGNFAEPLPVIFGRITGGLFAAYRFYAQALMLVAFRRLLPYRNSLQEVRYKVR